MAGIPWTENEKFLLKKYCGSGMSFRKMSELIPTRTASALQSMARVSRYENPYSARKYYANKKFWDEVNIINSYYAGFVAADGNVLLSCGSYVFKIELHPMDDELLAQLSKDCSSTYGVTYSERIKKGLIRKSCLFVCNEHAWRNGLEKNFNIFPRKTYTLEAPPLQGDFLSAWMAGFLDGDGCYSVHSNGLLCISLSCASLSAIQSVCDFSRQFMASSPRNPRLPSVRRHSGQFDHLYQLHISGERAVKMAHYLMSLPCRHMVRKYNKVRDYLIHNPKYGLSLPTLEEHQKNVTI